MAAVGASSSLSTDTSKAYSSGSMLLKSLMVISPFTCDHVTGVWSIVGHVADNTFCSCMLHLKVCSAAQIMQQSFAMYNISCIKIMQALPVTTLTSWSLMQGALLPILPCCCVQSRSSSIVLQHYTGKFCCIEKESVLCIRRKQTFLSSSTQWPAHLSTMLRS